MSFRMSWLHAGSASVLAPFALFVIGCTGGGGGGGSCIGPSCPPQQACFAPPCDGDGEGGALSDAALSTDAAIDDAAIGGDAGTSGSVVADLGESIEHASVDDAPVPAATSTGLEPEIELIETLAVSDGFVLRVQATQLQSLDITVHLVIDGVHYVVPIETRDNIVPGWESDTTDLGNCAMSDFDNVRHYEGCYPPCVDVCTAPEGCTDFAEDCMEECSHLVGFLDDCVRFDGDCGKGSTSDGWTQVATEVLDHYGSIGGYLMSLRADRLEGGWLCTYKNGEAVGTGTLEILNTLSCIDDTQYSSTRNVVEPAWQCVAGVAAPEDEDKKASVGVKLVPQDFNQLAKQLGATPIMVAIETKHPSTGEPVVSQLAPGKLSACSSEGFITTCKN